MDTNQNEDEFEYLDLKDDGQYDYLDLTDKEQAKKINQSDEFLPQPAKFFFESEQQQSKENEEEISEKTEIEIGEKTSKKGRKKFSFSFFSVLMIAICIACSILLANIFSNLIISSGLGIFQTQSKTVNSLSVYAISLGSCTTKAQADELAASVKQKSGAGFIYKKDNFYVLFGGYETENDAKRVQDSLSQQGTTSEIIKIDVAETTISSSYSISETNILEANLSMYKDVFRTLCDYSVCLDTNTKTGNEIKTLITALSQKYDKTRKDFSALNSKLTSNLVNLSLQNENIINIVKNLEKSESLSSDIKHAYLEIITSQVEMLSEMISKIF